MLSPDPFMGANGYPLLLATGEARLVTKSVGDRVLPAAMVVSGRMCMRVEQL